MPNISPIRMTLTRPRDRFINIRRTDLRRLINMLNDLNELLEYNPVTGHDGCLCDECMAFDDKIEDCIDLLEEYIE